MATIREFSERWSRMLQKGDIFVDAIEATGQQLIDVNKGQLEVGMGSNGLPLPEYARYRMSNGELYGDIKKRMNPKNEGRYDMYWTGESFRTMTVSLDG